MCTFFRGFLEKRPGPMGRTRNAPSKVHKGSLARLHGPPVLSARRDRAPAALSARATPREPKAGAPPEAAPLRPNLGGGVRVRGPPERGSVNTVPASPWKAHRQRPASWRSLSRSRPHPPRCDWTVGHVGRAPENTDKSGTNAVSKGHRLATVLPLRRPHLHYTTLTDTCQRG